MKSSSSITTASSPKAKKLLFILIDGVGDLPIDELGGKTPLQYAQIPWMDKLAENGISGIMDPVSPGVTCESDQAHMSILGYDPRRYYRGRGAFESMGGGLEMAHGDIAFKSVFSTLDKKSGIVKFRKPDRHFEIIGPTLCEALDGIKVPEFPDHIITVKYSMEHRCVVRVRGPGLTETITGTDPIRDDKPLVICTPTIDGPDARFTSTLINKLSERIYDILVDHPINKAREAEGKNVANIVLLRGCGRCIDVPSIEKLHGFKSFLIAPTPIIAGLGITLGMDLVKVDGATGGYDTDLMAKGRKAVQLLKSTDYTMGFVHIKAVDEAGHDKSVELKVKYIEKSDEMIGYAIEELRRDLLSENTDYTIVLTGDHTTPIHLGQHSHEPVPFTISFIANRVPLLPDSVNKFDESSAAQGKLGRFCGGEVMGYVKKFMGFEELER